MMSFAVTSWTLGSSDCRLFSRLGSPTFSPVVAINLYIVWCWQCNLVVFGKRAVKHFIYGYLAKVPLMFPVQCTLTKDVLANVLIFDRFVLIADKFARMAKLCKFFSVFSVVIPIYEGIDTRVTKSNDIARLVKCTTYSSDSKRC